jgi:anti-sigma B factor antagonist
VSGSAPGLAGAQVIALAGEIDPGMVIALHRRIDRALDVGAPRVMLDLSEVTVLGGQTVSVLCGALRRLARRGATIAIAGGPPHVKRVLERCAIDRLEQYSTRDAALLAAVLNPFGGPALRDPFLPAPRGHPLAGLLAVIAGDRRPAAPPLRASGRRSPTGQDL